MVEHESDEFESFSLGENTLYSQQCLGLLSPQHDMVRARVVTTSGFVHTHPVGNTQVPNHLS